LFLLPEKAEQTLRLNDSILEIAKEFFQVRDFLYLGRGINYPIALEGALKLKEISYIHAEGYPAGEMKHGPIALIDDGMPVFVLAAGDRVHEKILSNIEEVRSRGGKVIALAPKGDRSLTLRTSYSIFTPRTNQYLTPVLLSIPLQLFAYHIAVFRGCDVDQPRNLAKSVTVE
jgi:glucosamine--fructose-6-phosphate aminotransferase (isomerizing)